MITSTNTSLAHSGVDLRPSRLLSWGAIFAGCFVALSIHILLTMLGIGLGLRLVDPANNDNPVGDFSTTAGIVWSISALVSLAIGGWVAGRSINVGDRRSGGLHGFVVWSLSTVAVFVFLSGGAGLAVGGAAKAIGKGVAGSARAISSVGGQAAQTQAGQSAQSAVGDMVSGMVDELRLPGQQGNLGIANKREIGFALTRFVAQPDDERRNALITALTNAGAPRDFAETTVRRWEDSMNRVRAQMDQLKNEAAQQAREAADKASRGVAKGALWTFVGFLVGAVAASAAGRAGAASAQEAPVREAEAHIPNREDVVRRREDVVK